MKLPVVVIYCRNIDANKPPFNSGYYWHAYMDLLLTLKEHGADTYFATGYTTYMGKGMFSKVYTADTKVPVANLQVSANVRADIVYDKGGFPREEGIAVLNPSFVHDITSNKSKTYQHFSSLQPRTVLCRTSEEALTTLRSITSDKVVFKKLESNGGRGVSIVNSTVAAVAAKTLEYPQILQEFIDTSGGIAGLCDGYHDLRIKIGGGTIWGGTLRQPKQGELRANVALGGSERHLSPDEIPEDAKQFAMRIDSFFSEFPRYYAIDIANTKQGWRLIELNSKPGLSPITKSPQSRFITNQLAAYLYRLAKNSDSPTSQC